MNTDKLREAIHKHVNMYVENDDGSPNAWLTTDNILALPEIQELLKEKECEWVEEETSSPWWWWVTSCGNRYYTEESNEFTHCPFCGGKIKEK